MSFRHTYITQFIYDHTKKDEIKKALEKYCRSVEWCQRGSGTGYFHGVINDLAPDETKNAEKEILDDLKSRGIILKINYE